MPFYDFKCDKCEYTVTMQFANWQDAVSPVTKILHEEPGGVQCGGTLVRQPSAPSFNITGYNAQNGYSGKR